MRDYAMFWGCTIPARFPSIEKATRLVLDDLGVRIHELDGHTCCPEGTLVKAVDPDAYHVVAARNLAIVGALGARPGHALQRLLLDLQGDPAPPVRRPGGARRRRRASSRPRTWPGREGLQVLHLAEWLADVEGAPAVARRAVRSLAGMRVAVHYGCHLLRPQPAVSWDDPLQPSKVETLVRALGARVVDYPSKMQCCGGALDRVGQRETSLSMARAKLLELRRARRGRAGRGLPQLLPAVRPQPGRAAARRRGRRRAGALPLRAARPVLRARRRPTSGWACTACPWTRSSRRGTSATPAATGRASRSTCGSSRSATPAAPAGTTARWHRSTRSSGPTRSSAGILDGDFDGVLADGQAWKCLECFTCLELCPSRIGLAETLRVLKEHAAARDGQPDPVRAAYDLFASDGVLGKPRESARGKLGLPPLPAGGGEALARMLAGGATPAASRRRRVRRRRALRRRPGGRFRGGR